MTVNAAELQTVQCRQLSRQESSRRFCETPKVLELKYCFYRQSMEGDMGVYGIAVLGFFSCGISVILILTCGIAVSSSSAVCGFHHFG